MKNLPFSALLLVASLATPAAMLLACLFRDLRNRMPALVAFAPMPAVAASLFAVNAPPFIPDPRFYLMTLALDGPGAMLLGVAALLWIVAGAYASAFLRDTPNRSRFTVCWLLTLTGSLGVFVAADLAGFFFFFALASLPAYGLVIHEGTPNAQRAGALYTAFALLSETLLLMGFVLLAATSAHGSLLISDVMAALPGSPWRTAALALVIAGFAMKIALVPIHFWMPLTYAAAPVPAAAVLSGAGVKAGVIGLIRFLPLGVALSRWGGTLVSVGLFTGFYGVIVGITQSNPKAVLAYSSVSQMGFIATVLGMGQMAGDGGAALQTAYYAAHHVLVKGGLFLAVGVVSLTGSRRWWLVLSLAAALALSLGGLPLTGGAHAKLAVKSTLGEGLVGTLAGLSAVGSSLLMFHFLRQLMRSASKDPQQAAPVRFAIPWLMIAVAAIAVPWALYPAAGLGAPSDIFVPAVLWSALWPILGGFVLFVGLGRWRDRLPRIPEGDIVVAGRSAARATSSCGAAMEHLDNLLRQWPVASLSLIVVAVLLALAMLAGN